MYTQFRSKLDQGSNASCNPPPRTSMLAGWGALIVMALALLIQKYKLASTVCDSNDSVLLEKLTEHMKMYLVNKGKEFILTRTEDPILVLYSSDSTLLSARENYMRNVTGMSPLCASVSSVSIGSCTESQRKQNRHTCTYRHTCIYLGAYIHTYMDTHVSI